MELKESILFLAVAIITFVFVILQIRKNKLNIDDSIIWIIWCVILLVFGLFPSFVKFLSDTVGFVSTSNFVICLFIFFSYFIIFLQNIKLSQLKEKNTKLIQKISLFENKIRDKLK